MNFQRGFRRRTRPGWTKPSENEPVPIKRLRGLDEFIKPDFVGRMARVQRRRKLAWRAMVAAAVTIGVGLGLALF